MDRADITPALVSRLLAAQFPYWAGLPLRHVERDGWDNRTFRLGDDMSVRLPSAERYAPQVDKEHRWLPFLAGRLPLAIPEPLARGKPGGGFPWPWSVYRWLEGEPAAVAPIDDPVQFATELAGFLAALYGIDPWGGPAAGSHNFFRGGSLAIYDAETREAMVALGGEIDAQRAERVWHAALEATWHGSPVWLHGDVEAGNLLVKEGRLSAVIDFGCSGVGDPACDLTIAWTLLSGAGRQAFRAQMPVDEATWARGRGWALWKAMNTLARDLKAGRQPVSPARRVIHDVLDEHDSRA
ncbi:MAG TPA: aminoglycoside phosphotransferase family protein [Candidatus Acidoferrales bacterium]|nr:aminoglycoside phosphotransferase family protein [Candidatus Acidoferrales bacterium]